MKRQVLEAIKKYNLIEANDNILVGVSGGPDSMALLYVLMEIRRDIEFNIFVAHVNHGVRGKEALEDEKYVERTAHMLNLPYFSKTVDMDGYAKKHKISSEEAGRELRYLFFNEILSKIGGGKIAVAHNKNDQAETLLLRFFRGAGIDGLKGMEYKNGNIIRPLLGIERREIEKYLSDKNIESRIDRTNLETIYSRNRVRLEVLPYIKEHFNSNIVDTLWRMSEIMSIDSDFLDSFSKKTYVKIVKEKAKNSIILDGDAFLKEHRSVQQRIIRDAIVDINGSLKGITYKHISDALALLLKGETGKRINLIDNIIAKTSYNDFIIEKEEGIKSEDFIYKLNINDSTYLNDIGYEFNVEVKPIEKVNINTKNRFIKYFDYDKIIGNIYVRNRRDGDRFVPFGMNGSKKIKDYFIDEKVPKDIRDRIPIIVDDKNIIWVVGYRISETYKITDNTENVLIIESKYRV